MGKNPNNKKELVMEMEKEISSELDFEVRLEDGSAVIALDYDGKYAGAKLEISLDAAKLVDKLTDLIPGEWDDALLDDLAKRLLSKKSVQ